MQEHAGQSDRKYLFAKENLTVLKLLSFGAIFSNSTTTLVPKDTFRIGLFMVVVVVVVIAVVKQ